MGAVFKKYKIKEIIVDNDGLEQEIIGFKRSIPMTVFIYTFCILTVGLLRLIFHWFPHWFVLLTHRNVSLFFAEKVIIKDQYRRFWIEDVITIMDSNNKHSKNSSNTKLHVSDENHNDVMVLPDQKFKYFEFKKQKFSWDFNTNSFVLQKGLNEIEYSTIFNSKPLNNITVKKLAIEFGPNNIPIEVSSFFKLLFNEALNPFYIFQVCSCILWYLDNYYYYATCIIILSCGSLFYEIYELRSNEKSLRKKVVSSGSCLVMRKDNSEFFEINSKDLVPGDIIKIPNKGCIMSCDAVLMSGNCIVNESMLTGESVPITKTPLPNVNGLHFSIKSEIENEKCPVYNQYNSQKKPNGPINSTSELIFSVKLYPRHVLFCGTNVVQTRNFENEDVVAIVVRTGFLTAKGELVRSILFPKPQEFKFNQDAIRYIVFLFFLALIGFFYTIYVMILNDSGWQKILLRSLDLITICVPPALPVAMTIGVVFAQRRLKQQQIFCISPNTINVSGVVDLVCFDKTGTLTEEGLDLWGIISASENGLFLPPVHEPKHLQLGSALLECLCTCHSLTIIDGELVGDPLDLLMFQSTDWTFHEESAAKADNNAEDDTSKFGIAVPIVVRPPLVRTLGTHLGTTERLSMEGFEIAILRQFVFSSSLQRMSVITRTLNANTFKLFLKGSPEVVQTLCRADTIPRDFTNTLSQYTRDGFRVLGLAWRPIKISYLKISSVERDSLERDLRFLGLIILENRLKPNTKPSISLIKRANIRTVMITGDNMLTALSVARDADFICDNERVVLVNARPPRNNIRLYQGDCADINVEFHYPNDIQRPVTEIASTKRISRSRNISGNSTQYTTLTVMDRPDYHLVMNGKSWAVIREHYPHLISRLIVKGTVFARFSPDQKSQLVEELQRLGYYVAMCGDGANDCGALKTAHAGISLSDSEASVASPFTSKRNNISCVVDLIREGRCALTTSFGIFKFMTAYSLTQFCSILILYWLGLNLTDAEFLYIDLLLLTTLSFTFCLAPAYYQLAIKPPIVSLLSASTISSILLHMLIHIIVQVFSFIYLLQQPWYIPSDSNPEDENIPSMENTSIFYVCIFQYVTSAIVFSKGSPYRSSIFKNYFFLINVILLTGLNLLLICETFEWLRNIFQLEILPQIMFRVVLMMVVVGNFFACYLVELLIDGFTFRSNFEKLKRIVFPKLLSYKEYEKIRDEIDRDYGNWPNLIRSASINDIRADIFSDSMAPEVLQRAFSVSCPASEPMDQFSMNTETYKNDPIRTRLLSSGSDSHKENSP